MEYISSLLDYIIHIDKYLQLIVDSMGMWTYVILFAVIFAETGLVVTPFLPGDSLLFAIGALCGAHILDIAVIIPLLIVAANSGDALNYFLGRKLGPKVFSSESSKLFNKKHLEKTNNFYEKYGGKTIIIARFMPIVRTFAPFVAGVGKMSFRNFVLYSISGGIFWISSLTLLGYFFGGMEVVKKNMSLVIVAIIIISILPAVVEYIKSKREPVGEQL
ncbi:MAG: DedA family protein [Candidatus Kapabacteria bacterium]|nr:DedA family protein [Candidatus Kapabacteria bacterium]